MIGWHLVFVVCLPHLTMLAAREQAKTKLPSTMLCNTESRKNFFAPLCPPNPQSRWDCCYIANLLAYVVINSFSSQGVQLKSKQANNDSRRISQAFICPPLGEALAVGVEGVLSLKSQCLRRPRSSSASLMLISSFPQWWIYSLIQNHWEGRFLNNQ